MSQRTREADERSTEARSWLTADVEGRTVAFWIVVAVMIAVVVLGLGAWWVWGLGQGMPMGEDVAMEENMGMTDMPHTDGRLTCSPPCP